MKALRLDVQAFDCGRGEGRRLAKVLHCMLKWEMLETAISAFGLDFGDFRAN